MKYAPLLTLFTATSILLGCSSSSEVSPELKLSEVTIYAEPDANQNSAIAIDVVLIYDNELLGAISKMTANKYFEASNQLRLDNPSLIDVWRWELVPGQVVSNFSTHSDKGSAYGGIVFANYLTPGDHRVKIPPSGEVKILLQKNDLLSIADGSFDGLNVGTTASDNVPKGQSSSAVRTSKKMPCGNENMTTPSSSADEPTAGVLMQHQTIQIDSLEDSSGKNRNDSPNLPLKIRPTCFSGGCSN